LGVRLLLREADLLLAVPFLLSFDLDRRSPDLDLERDLRFAGERDRRPADLDLDLDLDLERFLLLDLDLLRLREREPRPLFSSINFMRRPFNSVPSSLSIAAFKSDLQANSTTPSFFFVL